MSTTLTQKTGIDTTVPGIPLTRLTAVEVRKMVNTRSGRWLLIAIVALTALVVGVMSFLAWNYDETFDLQDYLIADSMPFSVLLPVFGILTVTGEWGQRTSLTTFTLEPRRGRVVAAKLLAGTVLTIIGLAIAWLLAFGAHALQNVMVTDSTSSWYVAPAFIVGWTLALLSSFFLGFAFGMLIPNSAAAIVLYFVFSFVLPGVFALLAYFVGWFERLLPWIDLGTAVDDLMTGAPESAEAWGQLATSSLLWIGLPLALGSWLLMRREVK